MTPAPTRGRSVLELMDFRIDYGLCMDCGICVDVCPTDALSWVTRPVAPAARPAALSADIAVLVNIREKF